MNTTTCRFRRWTLAALWAFSASIAARPGLAQEATKPCTIKSSELTSFPDCAALPVAIESAVVVDQIDKIEEAAEAFNAQFDLRLSWVDPRLAAGGTETGAVRRDYMAKEAAAKLGEIWKPDLTFSNAVEEVKVLDTALSITGDGTVVWNQRLSGRFRAKLALDDFPFDRQNFEILVSIGSFSTRKVRFVHRDSDRRRSALASDMDDDVWTFSRLSIEPSEQRTISGDRSSQLTVGVLAERRAGSYVPQLFLPLFVTILLPLLGLWVVDTEIHERINWAVTGVFSLIALNFSVSLQYPALGPGSLVMKFFWIGYALQCVMFFLLLVLYNKPVADKICSRWVQESTKSWLYWGFPAVAMLMMSWAFGLAAW